MQIQFLKLHTSPSYLYSRPSYRPVLLPDRFIFPKRCITAGVVHRSYKMRVFPGDAVLGLKGSEGSFTPRSDEHREAESRNESDETDGEGCKIVGKAGKHDKDGPDD